LTAPGQEFVFSDQIVYRDRQAADVRVLARRIVAATAGDRRQSDSGAEARPVLALHMESSGAMIRASGIRHV